MAATAVRIIMYLLGVSCFVASVVFDLKNFSELQEKEKQINSTGKQFCDNARDKYPRAWTFFAFVMCKMFFGVLECILSLLSLRLYDQNSNNNICDTVSLFFSTCFTIFQTFDLLLLVLYSYICLDNNRSNQVPVYLSYGTDDCVESVLGTAVIVFNLAIKKNIMTLCKAICCSEGASKAHKILSRIILILFIVCIILAIMLAVKIR